MKKVKIIFFASLRDITGERELELEVLDDVNLSDLIALLIHKYPKLEQIKSIIIASVNKEYKPDDFVIPPESEIAIFPPVSGG